MKLLVLGDDLLSFTQETNVDCVGCSALVSSEKISDPKASQYDAVVFGSDGYDIDLLKLAVRKVKDAGVESFVFLSYFIRHLPSENQSSEVHSYFKQAEEFLKAEFKESDGSLVILRLGNLLEANQFRAFWFLAPLCSPRYQSPFVSAERVRSIVRQLIGEKSVAGRVVTLLGENKRVSEVLLANRDSSLLKSVLFGLNQCLWFLGVGLLIEGVLLAIKRKSLNFRVWRCHTLFPTSEEEVLSLCNPHNFEDVKVVGYNNGINHYGRSYPGKTVICTVCFNKILFVSEDEVNVQAGVTFRGIYEALKPDKKTLHVVPNYSYISAGSAFFIPVHGSTRKFSSLGETISEVTFYNVSEDEIVTLREDSEAFKETIYDLSRPIVVLRLAIKIKEISSYVRKQQELESPSIDDLIKELHDPEPNNLEIRKTKSTSTQVTINKYYLAQDTNEVEGDDLPRDDVGGLWDAMEEHPIKAPLFHFYVKAFGYGPEFFLEERDFRTFLEEHHKFPIQKLNFRKVKPDDLMHSPFFQRQLYSIDIFMLKRHQKRFDQGMREMCKGTIRMHPGKHLMGSES
ncbi:MAG: FAD-binding protein [Verrucomicrobiota bacterium]